MELEELKNAWASGDERLNKQEILKESVIREIIYKKTNKSLNKLLWSELPGIPLLLVLIPFIVYAYGKFGGQLILWDITILYSLLFCVAYFPYNLYKAFLLTKIDLDSSVKKNLLYINKFSICIKKEKIVVTLFTIPIYVSMFIIYYKIRANAFLWTFIICLTIFVILFIIWCYKKIYDKNIQSIRKSLEELKELEEE